MKSTASCVAGGCFAVTFFTAVIGVVLLSAASRVCFSSAEAGARQVCSTTCAASSWAVQKLENTKYCVRESCRVLDEEEYCTCVEYGDCCTVTVLCVFDAAPTR